MPDNDPLESLDNFPEGLHVDSLPASEVRRRGDRMRRRNTALATVGGVVAAAVFIGTPVALMSGTTTRTPSTRRSRPPTPTVTEDAQPGWLTEIPAEFPLADGFPETNGVDGSPTEVLDDPGPQYDGIGACQTGVVPPGQVDTAGITYTGESEDRSSRTLVLLADEAAVGELPGRGSRADQGLPDGSDGERRGHLRVRAGGPRPRHRGLRRRGPAGPCRRRAAQPADGHRVRAERQRPVRRAVLRLGGRSRGRRARDAAPQGPVRDRPRGDVRLHRGRLR